MSDALPHVAWRDDFSLGIASIDHEHQELVALINQIFARIESEDREAVSDDLGETHARISAHFALEEQLMRENAYDELADHKSDHEQLLDDIRDIMDAYEHGTYAACKEDFARRLEAWFVNHFKTKDARLHRRIRA